MQISSRDPRASSRSIADIVDLTLDLSNSDASWSIVGTKSGSTLTEGIAGTGSITATTI
jgi:hypothetical protein